MDKILEDAKRINYSQNIVELIESSINKVTEIQ